MKKAAVLLVIFLGLCGLVGVGGLVYRELTWVEQDLERLAPYAVAESYTALNERVHARQSGSQDFRFVVLGDTRSNRSVAEEVFSRAAAENPAFIVNTGDIVRRGSVDEYVVYHMPLVELVAPVPVIPVAGNHEEGPNRDFAAFKAIYGGERFSFDYGKCRFIGINNTHWYGLSNADLKFVEAELAKPGAQYRFVIFHIPPDYMENDEDRGFTRNAARLRSLVARSGVDHVFMGHIHGYASEVIDGVRYTITGGGGAPLATTLGKEGNVYNYVVVHVTPDGLQYEAVRLIDGEWRRTTIP